MNAGRAPGPTWKKEWATLLYTLVSQLKNSFKSWSCWAAAATRGLIPKHWLKTSLEDASSRSWNLLKTDRKQTNTQWQKHCLLLRAPEKGMVKTSAYHPLYFQVVSHLFYCPVHFQVFGGEQLLKNNSQELNVLGTAVYLCIPSLLKTTSEGKKSQTQLTNNLFFIQVLDCFKFWLTWIAL